MPSRASRLLAAVAVVCAITSVNAAPVRWSVSGLTATDGTTFSGGFTYDAVTNLASDVSILLDNPPPGSPISLTNWFYPNTNNDTMFLFTQSAAADYTGQATLWMRLANPLTDAGGLASVGPSETWGWGYCLAASCLSASTLGSLRGSVAAVPSPGTLALASLGLVAALASRRRYL